MNEFFCGSSNCNECMRNEEMIGMAFSLNEGTDNIIIIISYENESFYFLSPDGMVWSALSQMFFVWVEIGIANALLGHSTTAAKEE